MGWFCLTQSQIHICFLFQFSIDFFEERKTEQCHLIVIVTAAKSIYLVLCVIKYAINGVEKQLLIYDNRPQ